MNADVMKLKVNTGRGLKTQRQLGQGMVEYLLVLTVVVTTTVVIMNTISSTTANLINSMVNNIQSVTNVTNTAN